MKASHRDFHLGYPSVLSSSTLVFLVHESVRVLRFAWKLLRLAVERPWDAAQPLTAGEQLFVRQNATFWSHLDGGPDDGVDAGYVLVEGQNNPVIILSNASFAAIVGRARRLRPLFVLNSPLDEYTRVLASYPSSLFAYQYEWRYLIPRVFATYRAIKAAQTLSSPDDLLAFSVDGIRFGDVIYDAVLATGYATIREVDEKVLTALSYFFFCRSQIKDLMNRYAIRAYVGHSLGVLSATFARYLLQDGIEVLNRTGSHEIQVKKWQSLADVGAYVLKPEARYLSFMMSKGDGVVERMADEYLRDRFDQKVEGLSLDLAFNRGKRTFRSKAEFCECYDLDPRNPLVFIMLHEFTDYPHSQFTRRMIFRDFYDWFERTLDIARSEASANWIFKEHPAADHYPTRDVNLDVVFEAVQSPHIRFLKGRADFNARSLQYIADVIVTCLGTAGLEYACAGIPCVLASESPYSGFGFTIEPQSAAEYGDRLRHLAGLGRLNDKQIKAAKAVIAFQHVMLLGSPFLFCPRYDQVRIRSIRPNELWVEAGVQMRDGDHAKMKEQVDKLADFLKNGSFTQYIDLERYGFMKEAFQGR